MNTASAEPLTLELLNKTFKWIKEQPYEPHKHLVSPDGYRRVQTGGRAVCVSCGAVLDGSC